MSDSNRITLTFETDASGLVQGVDEASRAVLQFVESVRQVKEAGDGLEALGLARALREGLAESFTDAGISAEEMADTLRDLDAHIERLSGSTEQATESQEGLGAAIDRTLARVDEQNRLLEVQIDLARRVADGSMTQAEAEVELARARANGNEALANAMERAARLRQELAQMSAAGREQTATIREQAQGLKEWVQNALGMDAVFRLWDRGMAILRGVADWFASGITDLAAIKALNQETGISVDMLDRWSIALKAADVSGRAFGLAMKGMGESMSEIDKRGSKSAAVMKQLVGNLDEFKKLDVEKQFLELGAAVASIENPMQRQQAAQVLFARSYREVLRLFGDGKEEIRDFIQYSEGLRTAINDDVVGAADDVADAMTKLGAGFAGIKQGFFAGLVEWLAPFMNDLATKLLPVFRDLIAIARSFGQEAGRALENLIPAVSRFADRVREVGVWEALKEQWLGLVQWLGTQYDKLATDYGPQLKKVGETIGDYIVQGILTAMANVGQMIVDAVKDLNPYSAAGVTRARDAALEARRNTAQFDANGVVNPEWQRLTSLASGYQRQLSLLAKAEADAAAGQRTLASTTEQTAGVTGELADAHVRARAAAQDHKNSNLDLGGALGGTGNAAQSAAAAIARMEGAIGILERAVTSGSNLDDALQEAALAAQEIPEGMNAATFATQAFAQAQLQLATSMVGAINAADKQIAQIRAYNEALESSLAAGVDYALAVEAASEAQAQAADLQAAAQLKNAKIADEYIAKMKELRAEQQQQRENAGTAQANAQLTNLNRQIDLQRQVQAGILGANEAQRQLNIEQAKQQLIASNVRDNVQQIAERMVDAQTELQRLQETGINLGQTLQDAFAQTFDAIISGTRSLEDVWEGIGLSLAKALFEKTLKAKFDFDNVFKGNILDLGSFAESVLGNIFGGVGGSGGGGGNGLFGQILGLVTGGGGGASGGVGLLNLLTGGGGAGGGISLATVLGIVGPGIGAGGAHGLYGTLAGIGTKLLFEGAGHALISNLGQDVLALLGGETFAGTVGDWAGNSGFFSTIGGGTTWGGSLFGGGSVAGSFGGGAIGAAAGSVVSAGLGLGASFAGQATANAMGIRPLYGTEGQIHMAIGNAVAQIIGNYFAGPLGGFVLQYLNEILQPLLFGGLGIAQPPTKGTMQRRMGESYLDSIPIFDQLQDQYGDVTRKFYRTEDAPWLGDSRAALGEEAMRDISGFAGIFAQLMGGDVDGGGRVAGMVEEWTNILTDFFGRMDQEGEETGLAIRQYLAQAFREMGVDAGDAMEIVNELGANLLFAGGAANVDYFGEEVSNVQNLGEALLGTAAIYESELPAGVHVAALALESMSKDGVKAFDNLDRTGQETLLNLTEDSESFSEVLNHLFAEGFTIDTEEFERRLEDISASAAVLGEAIPSLFEAPNFSAGWLGIFDQLKNTVKQTLGGEFMKQLFDQTTIATAFEPVMAVLNRIEEFDLTSSSGIGEFREAIVPALLQGKENLEQWLPLLREMYENWREIEEVIDEALKPTKLEEAMSAVDGAMGNLSGALDDALREGLAVLADGGTYDEALDAFKSSFADGAERALKQAMFNAMVNTLLIQPLIQKWTPVFGYIVTAGMTKGFRDPAVQAAWGWALDGFARDAEGLAPLVFDAGIKLDDPRNEVKDFFLRMEADVKALNQAIASSFGSLLKESIAVAMEDGVKAGQKHFHDNLGETLYQILLDAIVNAFVDAAIVDSILAPAIEQGAALYAAAVDPDGPGGRLITPDEQAGLDEWKTYFKGVRKIAEDELGQLGDFLLGPGGPLDLAPNAEKRGHYETRGGDVVWVPDPDSAKRPEYGGAPPGTVGPNPDANAKRPEDVVEEVVKPPAEAWADAMGGVTESMVTLAKGLGTLGEAADELAAALRGAAPTVDEAPPPEDDGGKDVNGGVDGGRAFGGSMGPGSAFIVGERGPELVVSGRNGVSHVIPLDMGTAAALLGNGTPGYANGLNVDGEVPRGGRTTTDPGEVPREHPRPAPNPIPPGWRRPDGRGWGPGGPFIGPDDPRHPDNRKKPGAVDMPELDLKGAIAEAFNEFARGGDLRDFQKALEEAISQSVMDGVIEGMLTTGPLGKAIEKANKDLEEAVERAMRDGVITAQEQADLEALGKKVKDEIEKNAKAAKAVVQALGEAFGLGIEKSTAEAVDGIKNSVADALRAYIEGGELGDFKKAVNEAIYEAVVGAIIEALLTTGPLANLIDKFGERFGKALADAMEDGKIDEKEERQLRRKARRFGEQLGEAAETLGEILGPLFGGLADDLGIDLRDEAASVEGILKQATTDAIANNKSFDEWRQSIREALYNSIVDALVNAFIDSAVIQGLLAGPLAAINDIFRKIGEGQLSIAEANGLLMEQIGIISDRLNDPAFREAWDLLMKSVDDIRAGLGVSTTTLQDAAQTTTQAAEDACSGECEVKRRLIEASLGLGALNELGRAGTLTGGVFMPYRPPPGARDRTSDVEPNGGYPSSGGRTRPDYEDPTFRDDDSRFGGRGTGTGTGWGRGRGDGRVDEDGRWGLRRGGTGIGGSGFGSGEGTGSADGDGKWGAAMERNAAAASANSEATTENTAATRALIDEVRALKAAFEQQQSAPVEVTVTDVNGEVILNAASRASTRAGKARRRTFPREIVR